ncbi:MAG: DmsE family decaheme c-type cytochrome [Thermoanaerobaculaceae bacterium]
MRRLPLISLLLFLPIVSWAGKREEKCAPCHEELVAEFPMNAHGCLEAFEVRESVVACAACHEEGDEHAETGDVTKIRGFSQGEEESQVCLRCHATMGMASWSASVHSGETTCTQCHTVHKKTVPSQSCSSCHAEVMALFLAPSHHPLKEEGMTCASCHNVHSPQPGALAIGEEVRDLCVSCHSEKEGPFIFQHDPVEEDCTLCHQPHGSVADNLLVANEPFLCLQCHEFHFHAGLEARREAPTVIVGGRPYPNVLGAYGYQRSFATKCTQCHTQIHGSDLPSQGITSQGRSLTR